ADAITAGTITADEVPKLLLPIFHDIGFPPCLVPRPDFLRCGMVEIFLGALAAAARSNDQPWRGNDALGRSFGGPDAPQEQLGRLLADPPRADIDGGEGRAVMRRL